MVTRHKRHETDGRRTEDELRELLRVRTLEAAELRRRLRDLEERGGRFVAAATHAVMNPVTIVHSYLEILLSDLGEGLSDQQIEFVRAAHAASSRLSRLVRGIAELAALEMGELTLEKYEIDIDRHVQQVCSTHAPLANARGVHLSVSNAPDLPRALADPDRLTNAIDVVVLNAVQWTGPGGRVEVATSRRGSKLIVRVTDTGPGIPGDHVDELFESFARLPRKPTDPDRGPGLSLSVARRQMEAMGGTLELTTTGDGGSTFELGVPEADAVGG